MKRCLIFFIFVFGFGQVNWEREVIDTVTDPSTFAMFNSLACDTNGIPGVVYCDDGIHIIFYALKLGNVWYRETVDSGLAVAYGFSLIYDNHNIPHMSYYRGSNPAYLCYAFRDSTGWQISVIDTIKYRFPDWTEVKSSIALDTLSLPAIAYIHHDTIEPQYIKYAHYNGQTWDISTVEYNGLINSRDDGPILKFNKHSIPHIAFRQQVNNTDSLKIYTYDSLNNWVMKWAIHLFYGSAPSLDLELDKDQYPHIAYDEGAGLQYSWWDGSSWHTDTITSIGWVHVRITLALDSYDCPHIAFKRDMQAKALYCYKDTTWHMSLLCDSSDEVSFCDLGLEIDKYNIIHAVYSCDSFMTGFFKHAWRGLVGINETYSEDRMHKTGCRLEVFPNLSRSLLNIKYAPKNEGAAEIIIYDVIGVRRKSMMLQNCLLGSYQKRIDVGDIPSGIYFLVLKQNNEQVSRKFLLIK